MKEIVIISGKGGTGKTTVAASLAYLAKGKAVFADCDVDAADLHLILKPAIKQRKEFRSGHRAYINGENCIDCGRCMELCRFGAVKRDAATDSVRFVIEPVACEGCGVCVRFCPVGAIDFNEEVCGEWFVSDTDFGPMVHAKLGVAAENSGKLVTLVRNEAKRIALESNADFVLIDGSPGIGCPVIASLTAADLALIVTEPTVSGEHDMQRIAALLKRLGVAAMVCVNKWDINPQTTERIKTFAQSQGLAFAGMLRYDRIATEAQREGKCVVEFPDSGMACDIGKIWSEIGSALNGIISGDL